MINEYINNNEEIYAHVLDNKKTLIFNNGGTIYEFKKSNSDEIEINLYSQWDKPYDEDCKSFNKSMCYDNSIFKGASIDAIDSVFPKY